MSRVVQAAIGVVCFGQDVEEAVRADPRAFFAALGVRGGDLRALAAEAPRLLLYRRLVRGNLEAVVRRVFPETRASVGERAFDAAFAGFLEETGPRTHHLRDVPAELLAWAAPRWRASADVPPWAADLGRLELARFAVGAAPRAEEPPPEPAAVALDAPLAFDPSARIDRFGFAVHEPWGDGAPEKRDVTLLAYRDEAHDVRFLELSPLAAALAGDLAAGAPLGDAVASACARENVARTRGVLEDAARFLADLAARGVLRTPPRAPARAAPRAPRSP